MWEGVLKNDRRIKRGSCVVRRIPNMVWRMMLRTFVPNSLKFLKMRKKVSVMATLSVDNAALVGLKLQIPWWSRVFVPLLLWRRRSRKLVPVWSILLGGIIPLVSIIDSSISLVVVLGLIIAIASLLIL